MFSILNRLPGSIRSKTKDAINMFDMKKIGGNISRMRKAANLTQMELADRMGVSFQAVSNWERGQTMRIFQG